MTYGQAAEERFEFAGMAKHAGPMGAHGMRAQGPSVSIDTACSSSLVGAHLAATSFLSPACPRALVTGINLTLRAETTAVLAKASMLAQANILHCVSCLCSSVPQAACPCKVTDLTTCTRPPVLPDQDGRCKTLDASADGYMRGEAAVAHLLEAFLGDAELAACNFDVGALILAGTAVNQDGRSSSLTAPNGPSQQAVLRGALAAGDVAAHDIAALEMHGTGTSLGDPIEVFQSSHAP